MRNKTVYLSSLPEERIEKYLKYPYYVVQKCGGRNYRNRYIATTHCVDKNGIRKEKREVVIEFEVSRGTGIIITRNGLIIKDI